MGRYYDGDISGKFWFGVQSSDAANRWYEGMGRFAQKILIETLLFAQINKYVKKL